MRPARTTAAPASARVFARYAVPLGIVLLVFLCFSPVLHNGFVNWDDDANFLDNPSYRGLSPKHVRWMFTTFHWGHYHPLSWLAHGFVYSVWGMDPVGYHLISLVVHAASAVALYYLILTVLHRAKTAIHRDSAVESSDTSPWAATVGTLFFALHPLRVEAVAWATDLHEVLSTFFALLALLAYLRMDRQAVGQPRRWYALSIGCFALSLLSKAAALTLPLVLLILDVYPLRRLRLEPATRPFPVLLEKLPYIVLAGAAAGVGFLAKEDRGLIELRNHGVVARVMQSAYGLGFYLWKTVLPVGLSPLYLLRPPLDPLAWPFVAAALVVVALTAALWLLRRRCPSALAVWACYTTLCLPVLGIAQNGPQIAADRYTYLACLPWAVLVAAGVEHLTRPVAVRGARLRRRPAVAALGAVGLGVLGVSTHAQTQIWADSMTLWNHAIAVDPTNYIAYANRANARIGAGDPGGALADCDTALRFNPQSALAYTARANARLMNGDTAGALADCNTALRLNPQLVEVYLNRGNARQASGDLDGAIADFTEVLRRRPTQARAYVNRGNARQAKADLDGALTDYTVALRLDPSLAGAYYRRGNVHKARGNLPAAVADYTEALQLDPTLAPAYNNRAIVREAQHDLPGALADYTAALQLLPESGPFQRNVARARQLLAQPAP